MSYILDALKKSQRERALGAIPQLETARAEPEPRHALRRAGIVAAALVLVAGGVAAGVMLGRGGEPAPVMPSATPAPAAADAPAPAPVEHVPEPVAPTPPPAAAAPLPSSGPAPLLADTSLEFQRRVPSMTINVVSYSELPERRFVMIDLVMYREGQTLPNGVTVLAVEPDQVTFGFAGERFRLRP